MQLQNGGRRKNSRNLDATKMFRFYCDSWTDGSLKNYSDVAKEFGLKVRAIERIGKKHDWVKKRELWHEREMQAFDGARQKSIARTIEKAEKMWQEALSAHEFYLKLIRASQMEFLGLPADDAFKNFKLIRGRELKEIMESMKTATEVLRVSMGLPTAVTKADITEHKPDDTITPEDVAEFNRFLGGENKTDSQDEPKNLEPTAPPQNDNQ